jgi:hypothetical protein
MPVTLMHAQVRAISTHVPVCALVSIHVLMSLFLLHTTLKWPSHSRMRRSVLDLILHTTPKWPSHSRMRRSVLDLIVEQPKLRSIRKDLLPYLSLNQRRMMPATTGRVQVLMSPIFIVSCLVWLHICSATWIKYAE